MKSSWKKQRLATKNRSICKNKCKNSYISNYGLKWIAELGVQANKAAQELAKIFYPVVKCIRELQKANEVVE